MVNMFEIGDFVMKANNGICRIDDIGHPDISTANKERLYFFLTPLNETNTKLYVPTDKADNSLRRVITEEEAWRFIEEIFLVVVDIFLFVCFVSINLTQATVT